MKRPPVFPGAFFGLEMIILGITGGIATGKSTVTAMFADLGAPYASADDIARDLLGRPDIRGALEWTFPECVGPVSYPLGHPLYDGPASGIGQYMPVPKIDTNALRRLIFSNADARKRLEAILHPPIIAELKRRISKFRRSKTSPVAAVEIPLLFEAGLTGMVDRVVVVACQEETQIRRVRERLGIDRPEALQQIAAQMPLAEKIARADIVVSSDTGLPDMRLQVQRIWDAEATPAGG